MTILLRYCHLVFRSPGANSGGIHQLESRGMRHPVDNVDRQLEKVERGIVELLNELEINFLVIVPLVLLLLTILVLLFQLLKQMITAEQVIKTPTRCTQKKTLLAKMGEDHSFGFSDRQQQCFASLRHYLPTETTTVPKCQILRRFSFSGGDRAFPSISAICKHLQRKKTTEFSLPVFQNSLPLKTSKSPIFSQFCANLTDSKSVPNLCDNKLHFIAKSPKARSITKSSLVCSKKSARSTTKSLPNLLQRRQTGSHNFAAKSKHGHSCPLLRPSYSKKPSIGKQSQLWPQKYAIRSKSLSSGSKTLFCLEKFQC